MLAALAALSCLHPVSTDTLFSVTWGKKVSQHRIKGSKVTWSSAAGPGGLATPMGGAPLCHSLKF